MFKRLIQIALVIVGLGSLNAQALDFNKVKGTEGWQSQGSNYLSSKVNSSSDQASRQEYRSPVDYYPEANLDGQFGTNMYGTLDFMLPFLTHGDSLFFVDLRGQKSNLNRFELNGGLGYRNIFSDNYLVGLYGYYDYKSSLNKKAFSEATAGSELLGVHWDFHLNGYIPVGLNKQLINSANAPVSMIGHTLIANTTSTFEVAQPGLDAEAGRLIWGGMYHPMRAYLGVYNFFATEGAQNILGGRFRLTQKITSYLSVNGTYEYDAVRKNQFYFGVRLTFGGVSQDAGSHPSNNEILRSRMMDMVQRDTDVVTSDVTQTSAAFELPQQIYYVKAGSADGDGTLEHPFNNISEALSKTNGLNNSVVYVYNVNGQTYNLATGTEIGSGQDVRGSGSGLTLDGATFIEAGAAPTVVARGNSGLTLINMDSGSSLQGWNIVGFGSNAPFNGVTIAGANNVTLSNVQISGFNQGVSVTTGANNVNLNNVNANNNQIGLNITGAATQNIAVNDGSYNSNTKTGISITNGANNINLNRVSVNNNPNGLYISDSSTQNITVNSGSFNHNVNGIYVVNDASNLTFNNVIANYNTGSGLYIPTKNNAQYGGDSNIQNIVISGGQYDDNAISGIILKDGKHISIDGVDASNNGGSSDPDAGYGIMLDRGVQDAVISGKTPVMANGNVNSGLLINGNGNTTTHPTTDIQVDGGQFNKNGDSGIEFGYYAGNMVVGNTSNYNNITVSNVVANNNADAGIKIGAGSGHMTLQNVTASGNENGMWIAGGTDGWQSIDSVDVGGSTFDNNKQNGILITGSTGTDYSYGKLYPLVFSGVEANNNRENGVRISNMENAGYSNSIYFSGLTASANGLNGIMMDGSGLAALNLSIANSELMNNATSGFFEYNPDYVGMSTAPQVINNTTIAGNGSSAIDVRGMNLTFNMTHPGEVAGWVINEQANRNTAIIINTTAASFPQRIVNAGSSINLR